MDQSEDREDGVPPSKPTVSGEHENQTRDQRMENKLSNMTDYNELYWNQYPYYRPDITYYPPVRPVSDGIRPERPLASGSEPEPYVNPFEHHQRKFTSSSYMKRTQSDCREEQSKYETRETHNKRVENEVRMLTDLIKECKDSLKTCVKLTEDELSNMTDWIQESEDTLMEFVKLIWRHGESESDTNTKNSQLSALKRMKTRLEMLLTKIKVSSYMNLTQSDCREKPPPYETTGMRKKRMENKLSNMVDLMQEREDVLMAHMKSMENKLSSMADLMKQREDVLMAQNKLMENKLSSMADCMKQREDVMMAHIKLMDSKYSNMADCMKQREDVMMAHIKLMDNKLSNMVDLMKKREDAKMAHMRPRRNLEDKGSDSTDSEHEPRDEPSSHSDSDAKSSCVSFNSDGSMNRITDFKGSRPSAPKKKRLEEEGSD